MNCLIAQNKEDYQWIFSNNPEATEGNESYGIDFNVNDEIIPMQGVVPIQISSVNASISDHDGNLLFYSNGCQLVGSDHQILPNGSNLNKGDYFESIGDSCRIGYIGRQDILILQDPYNDLGYYHINKIIVQEDYDFFMKMRYSYIDTQANNGQGDVVVKNVALVDSFNLMFNYLNAIKHSNEKDWWIIQASDEPDGFLVLKLDENGISQSHLIIPEEPLHWNASASGTADFSSDGTKYAFYNKDDNLLLYEFDREFGTLNNLKRLEIKKDTLLTGFFSSIKFSPNSQFLYVAVRDSLWQVDTSLDDLEEGLELIEVYDGTIDPFPSTFTHMSLAPNCKIYIAPASSSNTYHVINKPDKKGLECDFVQRGIELPFTSSTANFPNFPKFRVDEEEKCDPTIGFVFGNEVVYRRDLSIFPNPSEGKLTVELPEGIEGHLFVCDMNGNLVFEFLNIKHKLSTIINLSHLSSGKYNIEFIPINQSSRLVWTNKIVLIK